MKTRVVEISIVVAVVAILILCAGGAWPIQTGFAILFGWVRFLYRTLPRTTVDWPTVVMSLVAVAVLIGGVHAFARSVYAPREPTEFDASPPRKWRPHWSLYGVIMLCVVFASGVSLVGVVHQIAWMATTPERLLRPAGAGPAARRSTSKNNLKQMGLALHNYHDVENVFPAGATFDQYGTPMHSWITVLLPYTDQMPLYETIEFEKPWNHPVNHEAFRQRLPVYENPGVYRDPDQKTPDGFALSDYAANGRVLGSNRSINFKAITDGTSNTILAGEINAEFPAWGDPLNLRDPARGINTSPDGFGSPYIGGANLMLADGSVRFVSNDVDPHVLKALATPAGGEEVDGDW